MSTGQLLHEGDPVEAVGPVRCSRLVERFGQERLCGGLVGAPAVGAVLTAVEPAALLDECTASSWSFRCASCGALYRFEALTTGHVVARLGATIELPAQGATKPAGAPPEESPSRLVARRAFSFPGGET